MRLDSSLVVPNLPSTFLTFGCGTFSVVVLVIVGLGVRLVDMIESRPSFLGFTRAG